MREIKFRVFVNDKIFYQDKRNEFGDNLTSIDIKKKTVTIAGFYNYESFYRFDDEDVKLMQFTGEKDALGTEIYEDDFIIEMSEDGDYYLKLVGFGYDDREYTQILKGFKIIKGIQLDLYFDENKFQGKHNYLIEKYNLKIQKSICDEWIDYQVVGNIHQNSELLELFKE